MKKRNLLFVLVMFLGFTGCAPKVISPEALGSISKLGVLSLHGTKMEVIERGITIFGNEDQINDISNWKLDKYLQKEMIKNLKSQKMLLLPLSLATDKINLVYENGDYFNKELKELMLKNNIDGLLVLQRGPIIPEHGLYTRGVTVIKSKTFGVHSTNIQFNFSLSTYQLIKGEMKQIQMSRFVKSENINNNLWVDTKQPITIVNLEKFESLIKKILMNNLALEMKKSGF